MTATGARNDRRTKPLRSPSRGVPGEKDFQLAEVILTDGNSAIRFDAAVDATDVANGSPQVRAVCHTAAPERQSLKCGGQFHRRTKCKSPICPQSCRPQGVPALRLTGTGHALMSDLASRRFVPRSRSPNARSEIKMNRFDGARRIGFGDLENQIGYTHLLHYHCKRPF